MFDIVERVQRTSTWRSIAMWFTIDDRPIAFERKKKRIRGDVSRREILFGELDTMWTAFVNFRWQGIEDAEFRKKDVRVIGREDIRTSSGSETIVDGRFATRFITELFHG